MEEKNKTTANDALQLWKTEGNNLVLYSQPIADISDKIQKLEINFSQAKLENRVPINGGLYAGSVSNLYLSGNFLRGTVWLRYYRTAPPLEECVAEDHGILSKFFGKEQKIVRSVAFNHENVDYQSVWEVVYGRPGPSYDDRKIILHKDYQDKTKLADDVIPQLKSLVVNEKNMLISEDLIKQIFAPVFGSLSMVYESMVNY